MAFVLGGIPCELCDGLLWIDSTGAYNASTRPGGYGGPGGPTAYTDFSSYQLQVWKPGSDTSGAADLIWDLLTHAPTINDDGDPQWEITHDDLTEDEPLPSGVWVFVATGVFNGTTYIKRVSRLFTTDIQGKIDTKMIQADPLCACQEGCNDVVALQGILDGARRQMGCGNAARAQELIDFLYQSWQTCC